ncbi:RICIN domain-containing protein [Streptomyces sp. NPDC050509]|uniref:RICIN domain-containing protein n=1 Tax=Streptomyces sp. NPDC050509 TaxID=3365620 RepID=UPI00379CFDED
MTYVRKVLAVCVALSFLLLWPAGAASADTYPQTWIHNQKQQRCMVPMGGNAPEPRLCGVGFTPTWWFEPVPGGTSDMETIHEDTLLNSCLDTNGSRLYTTTCNGGPWQQWYVTPFEAADGTPPFGYNGVRLKNVATGICIDNPPKNFGGSKIAVNKTCNNGSYQQWNITFEAFRRLPESAPAEGHWGMTWRTLEQRAGDVVHVGSDAGTNPYQGDTRPSAVLPLLCVFRDGRAPAPGVPLGTYDSWFHGMVKVTAPVVGSALTSLERANQLCTASFGSGWRMAEFHDGGGWSFWASGNLPGGVRFWAYIDDSPANPWS